MSDENFKLNNLQMAFMTSKIVLAERAYREDDESFFDEIVKTEQWKQIFGAMSWDQAYDRYEETLKDDESNH